MLFLCSSVPFSHAATVSVNPRLTLPTGITISTGINGGIIGSLSPLNSPQLYNSFATYANGTIYFNATGLELGEPSRQLSFTRTTYGNGTMLVKVQTAITPNILGIFQKVAYSNSLLVLTFTDGSPSTPETTQLQIVWGGLSSNLLTAAVIGALVLGPFLILIAVWKSGAFFSSVQSKRFNPAVENREATHVPWTAILILTIILAAALLALGVYRGL